MQIRTLLSRIKKYLTVLSQPGLYPALMKGVVPAVEHCQALLHIQPETLIDVGANKGQFSAVARHLSPDVKIFAFEPLLCEVTKLEKIIGKNNKAFPIAVGRFRGSAEFHVTSRPDSSSLLAPTDEQTRAYAVTEQSIIKVHVGHIQDHVNLKLLDHPILLKVDVQGGELSVLESLGEDIEYVDHILCEVSFVPLYDSQPLASDICKYLLARQFHLRAVHNISITSAYGPTQADFHFQRASSRMRAS